MENLIQLALTHDHVHFAAETTVAQEFLNIEQTAGLFIDGVFAAAVSKERAGDGDLAVFNGKRAIGVVNGEQHLGATKGRLGGGAGKNDIFHRAAAESLRALLPHDPGQRIDDVGFSRTIGAHHTGDAWLERKRGRLSERLKSLEGQGLQMHQILRFACSPMLTCSGQTYRVRGTL